MRSTTRSLPEPLQEAIDSELFVAEPIKMLKQNYKPVTVTEITEAQSHLNTSCFASICLFSMENWDTTKRELSTSSSSQELDLTAISGPKLIAMIADGVLEIVEGLSEWSLNFTRGC